MSIRKRIVVDVALAQPTREKFHGGGEYVHIVAERLAESLGSAMTIAIDGSRPLGPRLTSLLSNGVETTGISDAADLQSLMDSGTCSVYFAPLTRPFQALVDYKDTTFMFVRHGLRFQEVYNDPLRIPLASGLRDKIRELVKYVSWNAYVRRDYARNEAFFKNDAGIAIAVTNHTASAMQLAYPHINSERVHILYPPLNFIPSEIDLATAWDRLQANLGLHSRRFFLFTGVRRWIKNPIRLRRALSIYARSIPDITDVIALGSSKREEERIGRVTFRSLPYVGREELIALYRHAYCLLYPTLNEGFGYPPVEAMQQGTPAIVGANSSLFEVCENAALYADPHSPLEIATRMHQLERDHQLYQRLQEASTRRGRALATRQKADLTRLVNFVSDLAT